MPPLLEATMHPVSFFFYLHHSTGSYLPAATLLITGSNFNLYNLNVSNTAGTGGQAVALSARGDYGGFYTSALLSWQDTLYSHTGSQFFGGCYIEGAVDFIFGITGQAW